MLNRRSRIGVTLTDRGTKLIFGKKSKMLKYRLGPRIQPVRKSSHPNIITKLTTPARRAITPPIWTRFRMRLKQSIRVKTAQVLAIAKSQKKLGVSQAMLARRHRGVQADRAGGGQKHQNLNPQQEQELVNYIEGLPKRGLPPTREMVRNFGSSVAGRECSKRWVSLFLERN